MKAEGRGEEQQGEDLNKGRAAEETAVAMRGDGEGNESRGQIKLDQF